MRRRLSMLERLSSQGPLDPRLSSLLLVSSSGGGGGGGSGITQLTGQVTAGPGSGSVTAKVAASMAPTVYVSNTGSDVTGNGNWFNPYATITHAIAALDNASYPYGIILLASGTYTEATILFSNVHTVITVCGLDPANPPVVTGAIAYTPGFVDEIIFQNVGIGASQSINWGSEPNLPVLAFKNCGLDGAGTNLTVSGGLAGSILYLDGNEISGGGSYSFTDVVELFTNDNEVLATPWTITATNFDGAWSSVADGFTTGSDITISAAAGKTFAANVASLVQTNVTLDGAGVTWVGNITAIGLSVTLSGGAATPTYIGSGSAPSGYVLTADGSGNAAFLASASGGGINQLTGDGTAGPGTGSQALTVVSMQTGLVTANVPVGSVQGGTLSGFRDSVAGTGYSLGQGASSSHATALCFGYANLTGPPWVGTANYAIAGTDTDTYIAPAGGVNNNVLFGYDQSDTLFSMHMSPGGAGGNFQFGATQNFGGGAGVVGFEAATTQPSTNPAAGGAILWAHADGATGHSSLFFRDDQGNVYDLSATGGGGITALTNDVLASGSGSVSATVVQITGASSVCSVLSGTALAFLTTGHAVSTAGRVNFQGEAAEDWIVSRNYLNDIDIPLLSSDGAGDIYFGPVTASSGNFVWYGSSGNSLRFEGTAAGAIFDSTKVTVLASPFFFDANSNVTVGATVADYGGAVGALTLAPESTGATNLPSNFIGLTCSQTGQTLTLNANGLKYKSFIAAPSYTQAALASTSGAATTGAPMSKVAQAGQATTGAANPAALGGALALTAGTGGASNGANAAGGTGGDVTVSGGPGGAAAGATSPGGNGGNAFLMGGAGGTGTLSNGAIGGAGMGAAGQVYLSVAGPGGAGLGLVAKSIATTGGTLSLSAAQYLFGRLGINGTLAGALTIVFPNTTGLWLLDLTGLTTGAFTTITVQSGSASTTFVAGGPTAGVGQAHWIVTNGSNTLAVI
jgi:hypothetical protein